MKPLPSSCGLTEREARRKAHHDPVGQLAHARRDKCERCRSVLLREGLWKPGCEDPAVGHVVTENLQRLLREGEPRELLPHLEVCSVCEDEMTQFSRFADRLLGGILSPAPPDNRPSKVGGRSGAKLGASGTGAHYPLVEKGLGIEAPVEIVTALISAKGAARRLGEVEGVIEEVGRLMLAEFGFAASGSRTLDTLLSAFGRYVLVSEFVFDLPAGATEFLADEPHAEVRFRDPILSLCERLRSSAEAREGTIALARKVEVELELPERAKNLRNIGTRDTFPFQDRIHLGRLVGLASAGKLDKARAILETRPGSIWKHLPERALLWTLTGRCLDLLASVADSRKALLDSAAGPGAWIGAYAAREGLWALDRHQRMVEQGAAECGESEEVSPLIAVCRRRYREVAETAQDRFLASVARVGWPPKGVMRHTQTFDKHVAPALAKGHRVAYFVVDSLRFEMGCDLAAALADFGSTRVTPSAAVLPATIRCGTAALMPGADREWALTADGWDLIPVVSKRPLPTIAEQKALLGERVEGCCDLTLEELHSKGPRGLTARVGRAALVVVRTQDPEPRGFEGFYHASLAMTEVLGSLRAATARLSTHGFTRFVFASSRGCLLLPECGRGGIVNGPGGVWQLATHRCYVGKVAAPADHTVTIPASKVTGACADAVVPTGFRIFRDGGTTYQGGLSLQECVLPVVVLHVGPYAGEGGGRSRRER